MQMSFGKPVIDRNTSIHDLLKADQAAVITALVKLNKNFARLENPLLRKILAKRITIADACKIAGCSLHSFFETMRSIGFLLKDEPPEDASRQASYARHDTTASIELDVRPILALDKDPLKQIMIKTMELKPGQTLKIINSFEPLPLINLLSKKGFDSHTEVMDKDTVYTYFYLAEPAIYAAEAPLAEEHTDEESFSDLLKRFEGKLDKVDVRALDMPQPMVTILDRLDVMAAGNALFVHHKKVPVYLLPQLEEKGFKYSIRKEDEHNILLLIYKP